MSCSLALAAVFLGANIAPADTDAEFRALVRLPQWRRAVGVNWTDSGQFRMTGDTPLAREALAAARKAAQKHPDDPAAQDQVYKLLTQIGESAEATTLARRIVTLWEAEAAKHPKAWKAHSELAFALARVGQQYAAEASARWAVALAPRESGAWYDLALILNHTARAEAMRAMDKAAALAPDDDLDTPLVRALMRINRHQGRLDQLPTAADAAIQGAMIADVREVLLGTDKLLLESVRRLKAADGACGPDTRGRCLMVMLMRDILRDKLQKVAARNGMNPEPNVLVSATTAKLVREIVPPTSDDVAGLFAALSLQYLSTPGAFSDDATVPLAERKTITPYLQRLSELSREQLPPRAATAIFVRGLMLELVTKDYQEAESCHRHAARLTPTFDLAWKSLLNAADVPEKSRGAVASAACVAGRSRVIRLAREWAAQSDSAYSRYNLARVQAEAGDWPAAERTVAAALAKYPDDLWLLMSRLACRVRAATTPADFQVDLSEANAIYARLQDAAVRTDELSREFNRLGVLISARIGDREKGRKLAAAYATQVSDKDGRADALALLRLVADPTSPLSKTAPKDHR